MRSLCFRLFEEIRFLEVSRKGEEEDNENKKYTRLEKRSRASRMITTTTNTTATAAAAKNASSRPPPSSGNNDGDGNGRDAAKMTTGGEIREEEEEVEKRKKEVLKPRTHELEETVICSGRYRTEREINRGSSAVVIRGVDVTSRRPVALKIMEVSQRSEVSLPLNAICREVKYAHRLNSSSENSTDNFARLLNVTNHVSPETNREYVVLVWELLEGLDLLDYINSKGGRLNNEEARSLFAQLLNAVSTIHERGFAHRDLKPDNCLVVNTKNNAKKTLKVIDFGLSKGLDSAKTLGIGTPDYMAPELIGAPSRMKGKGVGYDPIKIDIFAMGVTLYLMLVGRYPFEDPTNHSTLSTMRNIRAGNFTRPQKGTIHEDVLNLIENMLTPDPEKRFSLEDIRNHTWIQQEREEENLLQEYDEFEKRLRDLTSQEEEAKRECEQEELLKKYKHFEKRLKEAQRIKEAKREREENAPNTLLGLRLRLVETKIDRKQEVPREKKKKTAAFGIASLFGVGRKK